MFNLLERLLGPKLENFRETQPILNLKEFYTGTLKAHGVARTLFGKVLRRFTADIKGSQEGDKLILNEFFTYDDGRTFNRQWELTQDNPEGTQFTGKGADIFGDIKAQTKGCAGLLKYTLKIPTKKSKSSFKTMAVIHWQYQIDETHALHFLRIKKFGFTIIKSTVMFVKDSSPLN